MSLLDCDFLYSPEETKVKVNKQSNRQEDIKYELQLIFKRHNIDPQEDIINELSSIYVDTPPWKPWHE